MDRIVGANTIDLGGGRRGFRGKDTVAGVPGTELAASWHNAVQEEIMAVIESSGLAPTAGNLAQLIRAIRSQRVNYGVCGGSANALTLALAPPLSSYADAAGMPLRIIAPATNTAAATINIDGLGPIPIVRPLGQAVQSGDLIGGRIFDAILTGTALQLTGLTQNLAAGYVGWVAAGVYSHVVGPGTYWINLEASGAGGGGAGANGTVAMSGGGGGAGGVAISILPVSPGDTLAIAIGAGGSAGPASTSPTPGSTAGGNGGATTVSNPGKWTVTCGGGFGASDTTPGSGNSGTGAGFGGYGLSGGYGTPGFALASGAGSPPYAFGGSGGANFFGGGGASLYLNHASGGRSPGSGGGGGMIYPGVAIQNGGPGLDGIVNMRF